MKKIGYARVSRDDQNPQYQHDALSAAGCGEIFEDRISGAEFSRAGLDQALAALQDGGVLVVWKLDRLGRSMPSIFSISTLAMQDRSNKSVLKYPSRET